MTASRPIIATMACIAILGLVKLYTNFVANMPRQQNQVITLEQATGDYALEITLTFRAESDAFDVIDPYAIKVTLDGVDDPVLMREDPVAAGVPIRVEPVKGLKVGENEFFVGIKIAENASNDGFDSADDDGFGTVSGDEDDGFATIDGFDSETPSDDDQADDIGSTLLSQAMRFRIFRGDTVIADTTLWSEPGEAIGGKISVNIDESATGDSTTEHDHDGHQH